jgi:hypothetical protein
MEIEQAVAAGRAVGEVCFNALIVESLIIDPLIIYDLITNALILNMLIFRALIVKAPIVDALRLVTLGRFRSRIGGSLPVVFNLSIAQMLRLFSHWTHISINMNVIEALYPFIARRERGCWPAPCAVEKPVFRREPCFW